MCVYVCIVIYIYVHVYIVCTHTHTHVKYAYICIYTKLHVPNYMYVQVYANSVNHGRSTETHIQTHAGIHTQIDIFIHIHIAKI